MGIYLSSPKTDKSSDDGENGRLRYGLSSMQGWRATMEDAVMFFVHSVFCVRRPIFSMLLSFGV